MLHIYANLLLSNSWFVNIQIYYQFLNSSGAYTLIRQQNTQYIFLAQKIH